MLSRDGDQRQLEPLAMDVLVFLLEHPRRVVTTDELLRQVWPGKSTQPAAVKKRIGQIRAALGDSIENPRYISTIPKRGYCLTAPVQYVGTLENAPPTPAFLGSKQSGQSGQIRSIAVLPLRNLSNDSNQQYVADGLTEEVITELAKVRQLRVISRTSVMPYQDGKHTVQQIAEALDVDFVAEGSVAVEGKRIRVTLHLIDARLDRHVWGHTYDTNVATVLGLRSELARDLAAELDVELSGEERAGLTISREYDEAAFDAYLRGVSHIGSPEVFKEWAPQAIAYLQRAVEIDKDFAEAWAQLALLEAIPAVWISRERFDLVREYAEKALLIDGRLSAAHTAIGFVQMLGHWDLDRARSAFRQALALSPNDPKPLHGYLVYLRVQGRDTEALQVATKLVSQSPHDILARAERAKCLYGARLYEDAINEVRSIRELEPHFQSLTESHAYFRLGRFEDSYRARVAFYERAGPELEDLRSAVEHGWAEGGYESVLRALLSHPQPDFPESDRHLVSALLGDLDTAFADFEVLANERAPWLIGIRTNPDFDLLRLDPRFESLVEQIGLPAIADDPPSMAELGRLMAFRGRAAEALDRITYAISSSPNDKRLPDWRESMAWAHFALSDYANALKWAEQALHENATRHCAAFGHLLRVASLAQLGKLDGARLALKTALDYWPDNLQIERDLDPLFMGGDREMRERFQSGLRKTMQ